MTRDEAVTLLEAEVNKLAQGRTRLSSVVGLLVALITRTRDPSLFAMVPEDVKDRLNRQLDEFAAEGHITMYNGKGEVMDYDSTLRDVASLLGRQVR